MSIIIHRCSCGHPDIFHVNGNCHSGCDTRIHELGAPEVIPTFVDGRHVEHVHKPGSKGAGYSLCGCTDCLSLWETVKTDAVPLQPWYAGKSA